MKYIQRDILRRYIRCTVCYLLGSVQIWRAVGIVETMKTGNSFPACKIILLVLDENSQPRKANGTTTRTIGTMAKEVHSKKRKGMLHVLLLLSNCEIFIIFKTD